MTELANMEINPNEPESSPQSEMNDEKALIETNEIPTNRYQSDDFTIDTKIGGIGKESNVNGCCSWIRKYKALHWYLAPVTCDLGHSFKCIIYQLLHWCLAFSMFVFLATAIPLSVGLCALACVGLILLYITFELTLLFTRLEFNMAHYLVERDEKLKTCDKWKLKLTLDNKKLPACDTCCVGGMRFDRIKFMLSNCSMYWIIVYHVLVNPLIVLITSLSAIPALEILHSMSLPIWYMVNDSDFKNNKVCYYGDTCKDDRDPQCKCYGWAIRDGGDVAGLFIACVLLLPLAFRFCNWVSKWVKNWIYFALTDYYSEKTKNGHSPQKNLLHVRNDSVVSTQGLDIGEDNDNDDNNEIEEIEDLPMQTNPVSNNGSIQTNEVLV